MFINGGFRWYNKSRYFLRFVLAVGITRLKGNGVYLLIYQGLGSTLLYYTDTYWILKHFYLDTMLCLLPCADPFCYEQPQFFSVHTYQNKKTKVFHLAPMVAKHISSLHLFNLVYNDELKILQPEMGLYCVWGSLWERCCWPEVGVINVRNIFSSEISLEVTDPWKTWKGFLDASSTLVSKVCNFNAEFNQITKVNPVSLRNIILKCFYTTFKWIYPRDYVQWNSLKLIYFILHRQWHENHTTLCYARTAQQYNNEICEMGACRPNCVIIITIMIIA